MSDGASFPVAENGSSRQNNGGSDGVNNDYVLDIYPLNHYYFGSKEAVPSKEETLADRVSRMKLNYDTRGLRTCVQAVMLVVCVTKGKKTRTKAIACASH